MDASSGRRLRSTFDSNAELYDRARPRYPARLFDAIVARTRTTAGARVLEIGPATGIATLALAQRGMRVTAVELGENLASLARARLAGYPSVDIVSADFETWEPAAGQRFDLVLAATSWHWIDPTVGYPKVARLLLPSGHLVVWTATHVVPAEGDQFFQEIQAVYDEIGEGVDADLVWPTPQTLAPPGLSEGSGGSFVRTSIDRFDWEVIYDADGYLNLLDTFSGHIAMQPWQRQRLHSEIRRRLDLRPDRTLRRHWGAVVETATPARHARDSASDASRDSI